MTRTNRSDLREPTLIVDEVPPRQWPLWARPIGYLGISAVWLAVLALGAFALLVAPVAMLDAITDGRGLRFAPLFDRPDAVPSTIAVVLIAGPIFGIASVSVLATAIGIALSSLTLSVRSLRPRYADEQLSFSIWSRRETIGPPSTALTGVTVSLLPIRMTRWSKVISIIRFNGFVPNLNGVILGTIVGLGYFWTVGWALWPASGIPLVVCAASSAAIAIALVVLAIRRREEYAEVMLASLERTTYARSWPNTPSRRRRRRQSPRATPQSMS